MKHHYSRRLRPPLGPVSETGGTKRRNETRGRGDQATASTILCVFNFCRHVSLTCCAASRRTVSKHQADPYHVHPASPCRPAQLALVVLPLLLGLCRRCRQIVVLFLAQPRHAMQYLSCRWLLVKSACLPEPSALSAENAIGHSTDAPLSDLMITPCRHTFADQIPLLTMHSDCASQQLVLGVSISPRYHNIIADLLLCPL